MYYGDYPLSALVFIPWNSNAIAGESITRATNGTIQVYKDGDSTTEVTTGVTDSEDFDTLTGAHLVKVDTSADGTFYASGHSFQVMLKGAVIDGKTINAFLGTFTINMNSAVAVLGVKGDAAADGDPTSTDTVMAYIKQLINVLMGTAGIVSWPASAAPGNAVSLAEGLRYVADQVAGISLATNAGDLATKVPDSSTLVTGTSISGSYTDLASNNDVYWITAPVTPAVGGFGLRQRLTFNLPLGRIPVSLVIRGYWTGSGQVVDVYALNERTAVYDKLTNTGTNLASRTTETVYTIPLPRDYGDDSGGVTNNINLEFRTASVTTTFRLRLDEVLVAHVAEDIATIVTAPTSDQIWSYVNRTLTSPGVEPPVPYTLAEINAEVVDALATDTYPEPGQGAPAATTSIAAKMNYLYKWARNKVTDDGTTVKHYADDATTVDQKRTVGDDGTTFTSGEISGGP